MAAKNVLSNNLCEQDSMNHSDMYSGSPNTSGGSSDGPYYVVVVPTTDAMAQNTNHNNNNNHHQQRRKLNTANILSTAADLSMSSNSTSGMNHSRTIPRDERRRATHNEVERRRRDKINTWITKLAKLIPDGCEDNTKQGQSKGGILAKACIHITSLTEQVNRLQIVKEENESFLSGEIRRLQREVAELNCENHGLKMALAIHGLRVPEDCNGNKDQPASKEETPPPSSPELRSTILQQQVNTTMSPKTSVISRSATTPSSNSNTKLS